MRACFGVILVAALAASAGSEGRNPYRVPADEALGECQRRLQLAETTRHAVHAEFAERFALQGLTALGCLRGGARGPARGGCAPAFLCQALSLRLLGSSRRAWDAFEGALRSRPSKEDALAALASPHPVSLLASYTSRAWTALAWTALRSRPSKEDAFAPDARKIWAKRERSPRSLVTLGWAQYRAGSQAEGLQTFMHAIRLDQADPQAFYTLARAEELFGSPEASDFERTVLANFSHSMRMAVSDWRSRHCAARADCLEPAVVGLGEDGQRNEEGDLERPCTLIFEGGGSYGATAPKGAVFEWGRHQEYTERSIMHCTLTNVSLSGNGGVISDGYGRIYPTIHAEQVPFYADLPLPSCSRKAPGLKEIGEAAQLTFVFGSGYYHWLIDAMPRLVLYLQRIPQQHTLLVPADDERLHPFMSALLDLFRIRRDRVTFYPILPVGQSGEHSCFRFRVRKLHLIDWKQSASETRRDIHHLPPRAALRFFRRVVVSRIPARKTRTLQVYVQRSKAADRRVLDEQKLLSVIRNVTAEGTVTVNFGDNPSPPMREAIYLFSAANVAVGMHGAGLANAVFMKAGGSLVEFALPQPGTHCYGHLAAAMGLSYWQVPVLSGAAHGSLYSPVDAVALRETLAAVHADLKDQQAA